jgi:hypothetical protein
MTTWTHTGEVAPAHIGGNIAETTVPAGDPLSLSLYEIKTDIVINNAGKYTSTQTWTNHTNGAPPIVDNDSAVMSSIKSIKGRFSNITSDDEKSRQLQTKRVGDYFQVRDTKMLPANAIKANNRFMPGNKLGSTFPEPPVPGILTQIFHRAVNTVLGRPAEYERMEWYRKRTFFFTGDWMAFLCAAHNEVNCVYLNSQPGGKWDGTSTVYASGPVQGLVCLYFD